ncbi:MAG: HK97 gp10 family phage protein [Gallionella sp.]|nr:HK97 gp10 family phage protein [Gallionella sp.]
MSNFSLDISRFVEKAKANIDIAARKTTLEVFSRVIKRSPVDTGRFRGNWNYSINAPTFSVNVNQYDKTGDSTIGNIDSSLPQKTAGNVFFLTNSLPYANRLENGWSKQSPRGMVQLTVIEFESILKASAK